MAAFADGHVGNINRGTGTVATGTIFNDGQAVPGATTAVFSNRDAANENIYDPIGDTPTAITTTLVIAHSFAVGSTSRAWVR
jgi:hypothetical protein